MKKKYISVSVYKSPLGDSTNGGISSDTNTLYVEHERGWISEEDITNKHKIVELAWKGDYIYCRAAGNPRRPMMGGNFIFSSDSRFKEYSRQPIPIHDRFEESPFKF